VQFPKADWHPEVVKQYSSVEPQKPLTEQHGKSDGHMKPSAPPPVPDFPQLLSVDTTLEESLSRNPAEAIPMLQSITTTIEVSILILRIQKIVLAKSMEGNS